MHNVRYVSFFQINCTLNVTSLRNFTYFFDLIEDYTDFWNSWKSYEKILLQELHFRQVTPNCCLVANSCLSFLQPFWLLSPWDFPGTNTGVGCYFLLQGIFLTQELNLHLLHWQADSILGLGRSPGGRNGNPLQYSCLENPIDRGAWRATIHGIAESDTTEQLTLTHTWK